jgi:hypothetical protein
VKIEDLSCKLDAVKINDSGIVSDTFKGIVKDNKED